MGADETRTLAALKAHRAELIAMLEVPEGVAIAEAVASTGRQPHTMRDAIAGGAREEAHSERGLREGRGARTGLQDPVNSES